MHFPCFLQSPDNQDTPINPVLSAPCLLPATSERSQLVQLIYHPPPPKTPSVSHLTDKYFGTGHPIGITVVAIVYSIHPTVFATMEFFPGLLFRG